MENDETPGNINEICGNMKYFHNLQDPGKTVLSFIRAAINTDARGSEGQ